MPGNNNQWMLFGLDVRSLSQLWLSAWQSFLFSSRSPLRKRLDEPIRLRRDGGDRWFQGGRPLMDDTLSGGSADFAPTAVELPDEQVLSRSVTVPLAAEAQLLSVLELEVSSASPFLQDDTVFGWEETARDDQYIVIALAIASRAAVSEWLHGLDQAVTSDRADELPEVWADIGGAKVCIKGFGEAKREVLYRKRLIRVSVIAGAALMFLIVIAALFALQQRLVLSQLESEQAGLQRDADEVSALRESLVEANEVIRASNEIVAQYPNPHLELARLTRMLGDDAFVSHLSMRGLQLRIRGRAVGAAGVMQTLAKAEPYAAVTAPQAITAVRDTGLEQFHLNIDLAVPVAGSIAAGNEQ